MRDWWAGGEKPQGSEASAPLQVLGCGLDLWGLADDFFFVAADYYRGQGLGEERGDAVGEFSGEPLFGFADGFALI